jgi:hypothetical protein
LPGSGLCTTDSGRCVGMVAARSPRLAATLWRFFFIIEVS